MKRALLLAVLSLPACQRSAGAGSSPSPSVATATASNPAVAAAPPSAASPAPPDSASAAFPPSSTFVVARGPAARVLRPWRIAGRTLLIPERRVPRSASDPYDAVGFAFPPDRQQVPFLSLAEAGCTEDPEFGKGLPILGGADFNGEPDRLFGRSAAPSPRVPLANPNPGRRFLVAGSEGETAAWLMITRKGERPRELASDLYRSSAGRWARADGSRALGVDFPFAGAWGGGVLAVERDQRGASSGKGPAVGWRFRAFDSKQALPALPPGSACAATRVTGLYTFATGEVIATGSTCQRQLVVERWAKGVAEPRERVVAEVTTDELGAGFQLDVVSASLLRVQSGTAPPLELSFDGEWRVGPAAAPLRQAGMLAALAHTEPAVQVEETFVFGERVFVAGLLKGSPPESVLLGNRAVSAPCVVAEPKRTPAP